MSVSSANLPDRNRWFWLVSWPGAVRGAIPSGACHTKMLWEGEGAEAVSGGDGQS